MPLAWHCLGLTAALLTGCSGSSSPSIGDDPEILPATESSVAFAEHTVHFNTIRTDQLLPDIATAYGISRSNSRAMLNINIQRNDAAVPGGASTRAEVTAMSRNLADQLRSLAIREVDDGGAIYYVAELPVSNGETLIFTVSVTPEGSTQVHRLRFIRQFFTN